MSESQIACWTHRGGRRSNQDAAAALALGDGRELLAVADGMGGHLGGSVASRLALETLVARLRLGDDLVTAARAANRAVHRAARERPGCEGMGTTLVALLRSARAYEIVNVGDSRAYRVAGGRIEQITRDHSFLAEARERGELAAGEAERSPWRHAVTRAIGLEPEVEVDRFGPFRIGEPQLVLLCSDGLSNALAEDELLRELAPAADAEAAVERLGGAALAAAPADNVTAALARLEPARGWAHRARLARVRSAGLPHARPAVAASIWRWRLLEAAIVGGVILLMVVAELVLARLS